MYYRYELEKKKHAFNFSFNFYWIIEKNILQDLSVLSKFCLGHPNNITSFPIAQPTHFFRKVKKNARFTSQRSKYFNLQAHDLINNNWSDVMSLSLINIDTTFLKGCLDV